MPLAHRSAFTTGIRATMVTALAALAALAAIAALPTAAAAERSARQSTQQGARRDTRRDTQRDTQALSARPALAPADSARLVRVLRADQAAFESFRRHRLPVSDRYDGPCDLHIGRYCYLRGAEGDDDDEPPPPESSEITARRDALIRALDGAAPMIAGDPWIAGQRVRYLVEAKRFADALRIAQTDCHAGRDWCDALAGYAAHVAGRFSLADSAFTRALGEMDPTTRCRWFDLSDLLDDALLDRFEHLGCDQRAAFVRRLFWLSSPLYSVSTTDAFTEYLARLTRARIAEHAADTDGGPWGDDSRELVLRYGWPTWYTRTPPPVGMDDLTPSIAGHDTSLPFDFLPDATVLDHVATAADSDWTLDDRRARTGYAPSYARSVHALPHQIARFRRGDSTLVVAAWDARDDTTLIGRPLDAALALTSSDSVLFVVRADSAAATGRLWGEVKTDSGLASLELLAAADRRAARARVGFGPAPRGRLSLSDLLLYAPGSTGVLALPDVRDSALTSETLRAPGAVGVYWETYGLDAAGEPVRFTLAIDQIGVSWMRRVAEQLHVAAPGSARRISWQEVPRPDHGAAGRGVRVDLSGLAPGRYRVRLTAVARDGAEATAGRTIELH